MIVYLCDFCGDEMQPENKCATFTVHHREQNKEEAETLSFFGFLARTRKETNMVMCAACLAHLLPITERIRRERQASTPQRPRDGIIKVEFP